MAEAVILVSGLPRSGTSLMMQMLSAGGIPLVTDGLRPADAANPRGYFEYEPVRRLKGEASWLPSLGGRAVKVVSPLLACIPEPCPCKVIFMERPLHEILLSQGEMLRGTAVPERLREENEQLFLVYEKHLAALPLYFARGQDWDVLRLAYGAIVEDPFSAARDLSLFLGREMDVFAMAAAVDPELYRSRL